MELEPGQAREIGQTLYEQLRDDPTPPPEGVSLVPPAPKQ